MVDFQVSRTHTCTSGSAARYHWSLPELSSKSEEFHIVLECHGLLPPKLARKKYIILLTIMISHHGWLWLVKLISLEVSWNTLVKSIFAYGILLKGTHNKFVFMSKVSKHTEPSPYRTE